VETGALPVWGGRSPPRFSVLVQLGVAVRRPL